MPRSHYYVSPVDELRDMSSVDKRTDPDRYRLRLSYILLAACVKEKCGGDSSQEVLTYLDFVKSLYHGPIEDPNKEYEDASKVLHHMVRARNIVVPDENSSTGNPIFSESHQSFWSSWIKRIETFKRNLAIAFQDPSVAGTFLVWAVFAIVFLLILLGGSFLAYYLLIKTNRGSQASESLHHQQRDISNEF
jgi:hypothetical protein